MTEPIWIEKQALLLLHGMSVAEFGGAAGLRDDGLLDSALARPRHRWSYGETDIIVLAAAYGFGLARNHPFTDGNKRAAFLAIGLFLDANGFALDVSQAEAAETIFALAAGETDEDALAAWLRAHSVPLNE
jgi:death on curing protein